MRKPLFLIFAAAVAIVANQANAEDRRVLYESRYTLAGFLLRASNVCEGNRHDIDVSMSLLAPDELRAFSKAFPDTTAKWMKKGADNFNVGVMKDGIPSACTFALTVMRQAEDIVKNDH